jgi:hypothetical protein
MRAARYLAGSMRSRWTGPLLLLAGLVLPQCLLYGPSLFGDQVLLPLEALRGSVYLPGDTVPPAALDAPGDRIVSDAVLQFEPFRQIASRALHAGHFPLWDPLDYCGAPFLAANQTALLSPLKWLELAWTSPRALAFRELLKALLAGIGAYLFFRRALQVDPIAARLGAWCFPLCGFLVLWANHPHSAVAIWLPWLLLFTEESLQAPRGFAPIGLAVVVALVLQSGHAGVGAHLLIGSGLYALGRIASIPALLRGPPLALLGGWGVGALLSAAQTLPTLDYLRTSARIADRLHGVIETAPAGWHSLIQLVLPYAYGATSEGLVLLGSAVRQESAATGYAGLLIALVLAPLGLARCWRRKLAWPLLLLALIGIAQITSLPLFSELLQLGPLATMRNHRLVLLTGFSILSLGVLGLDALLNGEPPPRWLRATSALVLLALAGWSAARALHWPVEYVEMLARAGQQASPSIDLPRVTAAGPLLARLGWIGAGLALSGALLLFAIDRRPAIFLLGALALGELIWMAAGVNPQRSKQLYYPPIPAVQALQKMPWGRAVCMGCMPANLLALQQIPDLRGYDGADPQRMVELLKLFEAPGAPFPDYARVEWFLPELPSPLADLLGLRYLIFRGAPPAAVRPIAQSDDYYVLENPAALPRAFVPTSSQVVPAAKDRLALLGSRSFDPRAVVLLEKWPSIAASAPAEGRAEVLEDSGDELALAVEMKTPGLLVLADSWDAGWRASWNGAEVEVLRADHALRAVALPAGQGQLFFRYQPGSFTLGLQLAAAAAILLLLRALMIQRGRLI